MRTSAPLATLLVAAALLSGCYSFEMARVSRGVAHDLEARTDADVGGVRPISVGPISLASAQFGAWLFAPQSSREARRIGRHVSSVKFSQRAIRGGFDARTFGELPYLERYERNGWSRLAVVRDSSEAMWVFLRERGGARPEITDLLAVVMSEEDLVVTKVSGHLSSMVLDAVRLAGERGWTEALRDPVSTGVFGEDAAEDEGGDASEELPAADAG